MRLRCGLQHVPGADHSPNQLSKTAARAASLSRSYRTWERQGNLNWLCYPSGCTSRGVRTRPSFGIPNLAFILVQRRFNGHFSGRLLLMLPEERRLNVAPYGLSEDNYKLTSKIHAPPTANVAVCGVHSASFFPNPVIKLPIRAGPRVALWASRRPFSCWNDAPLPMLHPSGVFRAIAAQTSKQGSRSRKHGIPVWVYDSFILFYFSC